MPCCEVTIVPFANESSTTVPYAGNRPTVTVSYFQDGIWYAMGVATVVNLLAGSVVVAHGGQATGVIKMVQ